MGDKERRDKEQFEFTATVDVWQAAEYLTQFAEALRKGVVDLQAAGGTLRLEPGESVKVEVEAESRPDKGKGSLQIELSWKPGATAGVAELKVMAGSRQEGGAETFATAGASRESAESS